MFKQDLQDYFGKEEWLSKHNDVAKNTQQNKLKVHKERCIKSSSVHTCSTYSTGEAITKQHIKVWSPHFLKNIGRVSAASVHLNRRSAPVRTQPPVSAAPDH